MYAFVDFGGCQCAVGVDMGRNQHGSFNSLLSGLLWLGRIFCELAEHRFIAPGIFGWGLSRIFLERPEYAVPAFAQE